MLLLLLPLLLLPYETYWLNYQQPVLAVLLLLLLLPVLKVPLQLMR
jgi:hypothetical protein